LRLCIGMYDPKLALAHVLYYGPILVQRNSPGSGCRVWATASNDSALFSLKDGARCSWRAARGGDAFVLGVTCKNGPKTFGCEYVAKPTACEQYASNTKAYWKQITRSLKKQRRLCRDSAAMVKAGMCRSAHFRLKDTRPSSRVPLPPTAGNNHCPDRIERLKVAEEYCSRAWSSLCAFFFLMLENDECS
uniref:Fibroblast growth factor binding protein 1b n=1 Tax=Sinocyclocheilus rhinocerous TaxID=307959 RepID=A0A673NE05_9TELE